MTKSAIVTGAARGIGLAIARELAGNGYALTILDIGEKPEALDVLGVPVCYVQGDLSKAEDRESLVRAAVDAYGRIDVLVNNAGVAPRVRADILDVGEDSFDWVLGINLKGNFFLTQCVAKQMIAQEKGDAFTAIVNIASMSSYTSSTNRPEYCISKAGVSMCTTLYADRLAEYGIGVYEVRPGIIATDMTSTVQSKYDALIEGGLLPIKRWGQPEDIARAVCMLATGTLAYSTGTVVDVDGGFHIRRL